MASLSLSLGAAPALAARLRAVATRCPLHARWPAQPIRSMSAAAGGHEIKPPQAPVPPRRVSLANLRKWKSEKRPIVMVTAYNYPGAVHADLAGIDIILVGDSLGMVELGQDTTQFVTVDEMLHHCRAVGRGAKRPFIVGDMPFGSYETSVRDAMKTAFRLVKEGGVNAVKLEGGKRSAPAIHAIVESGIAVMGHVGLTPASVSALGGFRSMGRSAKEALLVLEDALAVQEAGAFACVLECVPSSVAELITNALDIPTIGIGAGRHTSGQVLVYHDLLGMLQHPQHAKVTPKFCKQYGNVGMVVQQALEAYRDDVRAKAFPGDEFSPYKIPDTDFEAFRAAAVKAGLVRKTDAYGKPRHTAAAAAAAPEEENIKVY